ncbi:phage major capsid protein, P2 family [Orrella dioscoreae]|uniref:Phage major capsid protein n=1 Tax=Orrella dioscoreae TaxID=1851544 RepID=A0A1C3K3F9_9BURK|nr:phage major capsid protein, P2 family [Orrella dioscoreae]SBT25984.1 Phage major capsid protein [Orrella dioscoreae]SOE50851.1 Phage major capsid protein [Orrella dioscoreae]
MRNPTRVLFDQYRARVAQLNRVSDTSTSFSVEPAIQQTMEQKIQESSAFLTSINMPIVVDQVGQKIGLGVSGPAASRTDTTAKSRETRDITAMDPNGYHCVKTNFDTHLSYAKLDAWARQKAFQNMVRDAVLKRQGLDRIMVGWNGTSAAVQTNLQQNPLLQDVNVGWLQKMRERAALRVIREGAAAGSKVRIGKGGDFANIDAAVFDLVTALEPWFQDDTELVAIVGRGLLHDKYFPLVNNSEAATEKVATDIIMSQKRVGGQRAVVVPYFPAGTVFLTRLDNLSIYVQEGSRRRHIKDAPERDRVEFYESSNEDYAIEDYGCGALLENIQLLDAEGNPIGEGGE